MSRLGASGRTTPRARRSTHPGGLEAERRGRHGCDDYQRKSGRVDRSGAKWAAENILMEIDHLGILPGLLVAFASFPVAFLAARIFLGVLLLAISPRR